VWGQLPSMRWFTHKGGKVKMNRWFNWVQKTQLLRESWTSLLLVLTYMGIQTGNYRSIYDSPLVGCTGRPQPTTGY
jgi:hypothetical protein